MLIHKWKYFETDLTSFFNKLCTHKIHSIPILYKKLLKRYNLLKQYCHKPKEKIRSELNLFDDMFDGLA